MYVCNKNDILAKKIVRIINKKIESCTNKKDAEIFNKLMNISVDLFKFDYKYGCTDLNVIYDYNVQNSLKELEVINNKINKMYCDITDEKILKYIDLYYDTCSSVINQRNKIC